MKKVSVFFAPGFEEVEGLTVVDLLRRAGAEVTLVAVGAERMITGSNGITIKADSLYSEMDFEDMDLLVLPGGQPGTTNLKASKEIIDLFADFHKKGKKIAAICAAPTVFGQMGILNGRRATCYPGCEGELTGALVSEERVVIDENITTSRGIGTAISFALSLIEQLMGKEKSEQIRKGIVYGH